MIIQPHVLKGFRDSLPQTEIIRKKTIHTLEHQFESFGFMPIDTPALEYTEVLLGKGGGETDKQVYAFTDHGGREVSLRFDLTVPFARFMAAHSSELALPFKRYHIDKVWRGENTQKGRYREFYQCDFDIVGIDNASSDFEIVMMMISALTSLQLPDFHIHLSHRGLFNLLLQQLNLQEHSAEILRIVDKTPKIGKEAVLKLLRDFSDSESCQAIVSFTEAEGSFMEILQRLEQLSGGRSTASSRLKEVYEYAEAAHFQDYLVLNPSITRGLDYYTGIVFESFLDDLPGIGSICSGGRYNDLASLYTKEKLPGVGASIGLDRLLSALEELKLTDRAASVSDVLILCMDESLTGFYHDTARRIRMHGLNVEVYLQKRKLQKQFQYAEKHDIPFALILGEDEKRQGVFSLKNLHSFEQHIFESIESCVNYMKTQKKA